MSTIAQITFIRGPLPRTEIKQQLPIKTDIFIPMNTKPSSWRDLYVNIHHPGGLSRDGSRYFRPFELTAYIGRMTTLETFVYITFGQVPKLFMRDAFSLAQEYLHRLSL